MIPTLILISYFACLPSLRIEKNMDNILYLKCESYCEASDKLKLVLQQSNAIRAALLDAICTDRLQVNDK